jgi:hypothetical protein
MAAIAATNVTITCNREDMAIAGQRRGLATIAFGNSALTYPSGGVPMPAIGNFGMVRDLNMKIFDPGGSGIVWQYDKTNNKLRGFIPGVTVSAAGSATIDDFQVNNTTDILGTTGMVLGLGSDAEAGTYYFGSLKEIKTGAAVAAQTLLAEVFGW